MKTRTLRCAALAGLVLGAGNFAAAATTTVNWYGVDGTHPFPIGGTYAALTSLNDGNNGLGAFDFVGDSADAGVSWTSTASYLFFRTRVANTAAVTSTASTVFKGTFTLMIDRVGWNYSPNGAAGYPDYAFAWDNMQHAALEMQVPNQNGATWGDVKMDDLDGNGGQVQFPDFNISSGIIFTNKGDAFLRTQDQISTTNLGVTSYIEMAVSWDYLTTNTTLAPGQNWRIQVGSITNANDHNAFNADVAGGFGLTSAPTTSWSNPVSAVPEPTALMGAAVTCLLGLARRRSTR